MAFPQVHSHLEAALGQEAGRPGYSLETGRTWGHWRVVRKPPSACAPALGRHPVSRVIFGACSGRGLQTHGAFTVHPPAPPH